MRICGAWGGAGGRRWIMEELSTRNQISAPLPRSSSVGSWPRSPCRSPAGRPPPAQHSFADSPSGGSLRPGPSVNVLPPFEQVVSSVICEEECAITMACVAAGLSDRCAHVAVDLGGLAGREDAGHVDADSGHLRPRAAPSPTHRARARSCPPRVDASPLSRPPCACPAHAARTTNTLSAKLSVTVERLLDRLPPLSVMRAPEIARHAAPGASPSTGSPVI
jgi:hypothetical protein